MHLLRQYRLDPLDSPSFSRVVTGLAVVSIMTLLVGFPNANVWTMALIALGVLLTIVCPSMMIAVVVATVPMQEAILLPYLRGDLTLTQIAVFGLVIGWTLTFWRHRIWLDAITMWYAAIGAALLISLIAMDETGLWAGEVYRWAVAALFFLICRSVLRDWGSIRIVIWSITLSTLGTWAFSIGQEIANEGPEHMMRDGWLRVSATFGTPNPLAAYVEFTIPLLLVLAVLGVRSSFRRQLGTMLWVVCGLTSLLGVVILALTQSRGGMVGFAMAMIVVLWALPTRLRLGTIIAGTAIGLVLALTPAGQSQFDRFSRVFDSSTDIITEKSGRIDDRGFGRSSLWIAAIRMFEDQPWTGVGAGEYDYNYREYTPVWYDRFPKGQAHNGWLQMAAQAGIAGVVAFTGWVIASLVSLFGAARRSTAPISRALAIGALAVLLAFTIHSLVDYLNVLSLGLQISVVTAIGINLAPEPLSVYEGTDPAPASAIGSPRTGFA